MLSKRGSVATALASVLLAGAFLVPAPVWADGPDAEGASPALTPAQEAWYRAKASLADSYSSEAMGPLAPEPICLFSPCEPTSMTLATRARQQNNDHYCGPATGQVLINLSRGIVDDHVNGERVDSNWKLQSKIAEWMGTDVNLETGGAAFRDALNRDAAILKPVPEWHYVFETTGNAGALQSKVIVDVYGYGMALGIQTVPNDAGAGPHLSSWSTACAGCHHWIALRGYSGRVSDASLRIYYNDSSDGLGGDTGAFSDLTTVIEQVNQANNNKVVW